MRFVKWPRKVGGTPPTSPASLVSEQSRAEQDLSRLDYPALGGGSRVVG